MIDENEKAPRDMSDEELQGEAAWDFDNAERLPPPERKTRAVVSVAFPSDALASVSTAARYAGMKLSHFIREAAIEKAAAATPTHYLDALPSETMSSGSAIMHSVEKDVAVSA